MTKRKMTNGEMFSLYQIVKTLIKQSNIPLKFVIAKNAKILQEKVSLYETKKEELFAKAVKIDEAGNPCLLPEFKDQEGSPYIEYACYEFNSPQAYQDMITQLDLLVKEVEEVELHTEKASRLIKVSTEKDGKITYSEATIEEILEDPNNSISSGIVMTLNEYMLD